ncbi:hypothetical protein Tco_0705465 [Tanacetum coccineum]|uniref:Uncharacterized protein n=1 Tax=Tanacetum coccineum TaxID=301880 RepID=A0ABQ4Y4P0_9ASTR
MLRVDVMVSNRARYAYMLQIVMWLCKGNGEILMEVRALQKDQVIPMDSDKGMGIKDEQLLDRSWLPKAFHDAFPNIIEAIFRRQRYRSKGLFF